MDVRALLAVGIGGAIGALLRFVVNQLFVQRFGTGFPFGTLFINVSGSLLIGIVAELAMTRSFGMSPYFRLFTAVGVLGGYTTFSTYSLDTLNLVADRARLLALVYAVGSMVLGFFAAFAGQVLARIAIR